MNNLDDYIPEAKSKLASDTKKNLGICEECGKTFEQGFRINSKTGEKLFNKFKYCPKCRKKTDKDSGELKTKSVKIKYKPYPWQQKFHSSKARCKVISGAARTGKDRSCTMEFSDKFIQMLNEERDYTFVPKVHRMDNCTYVSFSRSITKRNDEYIS